MFITRIRIRAFAITSIVLAIPAVAAGQQLLRTHSGGAAGDGFGVVRPAGDVNHDGKPDLIVGAPHHATGAGPDVGSARVISGGDGATLFTLSGAAAGDLFGWSCGTAGDIDGDGKDDVVVGAPGAPGSSAPGTVRIFSGADGAVLRTFTGGQPGGGFGFAVAGGFDLDLDGTPDVVVGAPRQDDGGTDTGSAIAFSGATGEPLHVIDGGGPGDRLGSAVDVHPLGPCQMGDNEPGVIIGCTQGGSGGPGHVLLLSRSFDVLHIFSGATAGGAFGTSAGFAGDVDDDGTPDIFAGSDPGGSAGSVKLWSGATNAGIASFGAPAAGTGFGSVVAAVGDVDGDGHADVAVGEPLADVGGTDAGSIRIYSGTDGALLHLVHGPGAGAHFGSSLACAGDVSGDLLADFAVGAPGDDTTGTDAGSVFVLSLTRWEDLGSGQPGINGIPRLTGQGGLVAQTQATLALRSARSITSATLVLGFSLHVDATAGVLLPTPDIVTTGLLTGPEGDLDYTFEWPTGMPSGFTCYYQFVVNDPDAPGGQARSNTVAALVP